uniref:Uncharacterized protein n=1 Tax=Parastrongyloides trichosuri TaxID=131310 RepID=A0A0N4ZB71_PARTI
MPKDYAKDSFMNDMVNLLTTLVHETGLIRQIFQKIKFETPQTVSIGTMTNISSLSFDAEEPLENVSPSLITKTSVDEKSEKREQINSKSEKEEEINSKSETDEQVSSKSETDEQTNLKSENEQQNDSESGIVKQIDSNATNAISSSEECKGATNQTSINEKKASESKGSDKKSSKVDNSTTYPCRLKLTKLEDLFNESPSFYENLGPNYPPFESPPDVNTEITYIVSNRSSYSDIAKTCQEIIDQKLQYINIPNYYNTYDDEDYKQYFFILNNAIIAAIAFVLLSSGTPQAVITANFMMNMRRFCGFTPTKKVLPWIDDAKTLFDYLQKYLYNGVRFDIDTLSFENKKEILFEIMKNALKNVGSQIKVRYDTNHIKNELIYCSPRNRKMWIEENQNDILCFGLSIEKFYEYFASRKRNR